MRRIHGNLLKAGAQVPQGTALAITCWDDSGQPWRAGGHMESDGRVVLDVPDEVDENLSVGWNFQIIAPGCVPFSGRALTPPAGGDLELTNPENGAEYSIALEEGPNPFD